MQEQLTTSEREYLKTILLVQQGRGRVTVQALAREMDIKPASVSAMIRHLAQDEDGQGAFVTHTLSGSGIDTSGRAGGNGTTAASKAT